MRVGPEPDIGSELEWPHVLPDQKLGLAVSTHFPRYSRLASPAVPVPRLTSKLPGLLGLGLHEKLLCPPNLGVVVISDLGKRLCGH